MFSSGRKAAGGAARAGARSGAVGLSFIGPDVVVSGDVVSEAQIHIDGRVDGNVRCATLVQGASGTVAGHINADAAHLAGLVDGTVRARLVTLEPSARVTGDVTYETLSIAAGASIEGRLTRQEAGQSLTVEPVPMAVPEPRKPSSRSPKSAQPELLPIAGPAAAA